MTIAVLISAVIAIAYSFCRMIAGADNPRNTRRW